jgi:hypothetical protein
MAAPGWLGAAAGPQQLLQTAAVLYDHGQSLLDTAMQRMMLRCCSPCHPLLSLIVLKLLFPHPTLA